MAAGRQFLLLLWKNWTLQKRKVLLTFFEIFFPALLALILIPLRIRVQSVTYPNVTTWDDFNVDRIPPLEVPILGNISWKLVYTPNNPVVERMMGNISANIGIRYRGLGFKTEDDLIRFMSVTNLSNIDVLCGIVFTNSFENDQLPKDISYKIRFPSEQSVAGSGSSSIITTSYWYTSSMFPRRPGLGPRAKRDKYGGTPNYRNEGFLAVQKAVDLAIINEINGSSPASDIGVKLKRLPYPNYKDDPFTSVLTRQFPLILLLSFIITAPNICKDIVLEKEKKLKESMKMMGLSNWLHWMAWFVKYFTFLLMTVIIMTFLFCINVGPGATINFSDPTLIFVFIMLYSITTIMFCFAVSVFFSKANSGAAAGGILFLATYVPYFFFQVNYDNLTFSVKMGTSILHSVGMAFGCVQISQYESTGAGLQWHNFYKPVSVDEDFTMAHVFIMFFVDMILYGLIAWYFDAVFPGDYGIPKPPYFPFTKRYWCGPDKTVALDTEAAYDHTPASDFFEEIPTNVKAGVRIRGLRKVFKKSGNEKVAVDDMNLDMLEGQITALLGHNGAGKTTTMSMLTGFIPVTSGKAEINGLDIRKDMDIIRTSLGLCPQHDVLFDQMTVEEHLYFFAKLKGMSADKLQPAIDEMIEILNLQSKRDVFSSKLSGGMKRKLSVGIALIADSKVVILDEPTSGMDPEARRQIWDVLQNFREGRTMLLTTHFMDEADVLGDRIAIMAEGVVQCCGSSLFLKGKYGAGYHMVMVKLPNCDVEKVTALVQDYVPEATLESNISAELSYVLPQESSNKFEALFTQLEENKEKLHISSFGASVTTMEEVFLKVGESLDGTLAEKLHHVEKEPSKMAFENLAYEEKDEKQGNDMIQATKNKVHPHQSGNQGDFSLHGEIVKLNGSANKSCFNGGATVSPIDEPNYATFRDPSFVPEKKLNAVLGTELERNSGIILYLQQFRAMFLKRVIHSWRNLLVTITQFFVPILFASVSCIVLKVLPGEENPPPLDLNLNKFSYEQSVVYETNSNSSVVLGLTDSFQEILKNEVRELVYTNVLPNTPDIESYILSEARYSIERYNRELMAGASFMNDTGLNKIFATAHFNGQAYHTPAMSLGLIMNTLMVYFLGDSYRISTTNHPLPFSDNARATEELGTSGILSFIISYNVMFGMAFLIGTFVVFLIKEKNIKAKHCQFVSGVHSVNFWMSTFAWDYINYILPACCLLIVFAAFQIEPYSSSNTGYLVLLFFLYGFAVLPLVYLLSNLFTEAATGYVWVTVLDIFFGTASVMAVAILNIPGLDTEDVAEVLEWVFYIILPNFCLGNGLTALYVNYETKRICDGELFQTICPGLAFLNFTSPCCKESCGSNCANYEDNPLAWTAPGIGRAVVFLSMQGVIYMSLVFLVESGTVNRCWQRAVEGSLQGDTEHYDNMDMERPQVEEDDDVTYERKRIAETPIETLCETDSLILSEIKKYYGNFLAVDRLSMGIPQGECFGLLGVNGAGKTTTFKMLTGDVNISRGDAFLDGFSCKTDIKQVQQRLGYCPQFDALIDQMTCRETLTMYARLRGVVERQIPDVVDGLVSALLLNDHAHKLAKDLSGGNKRKLSTAIALVGDPPIIFLDEPTTGMDPVARRLLWDTLTKVRASGRTLVLTSHSMEECEALCTRLAIMVNGQFKCLGSTQHLKYKFGKGYILIAKVRITPDIDIDSKTKALMTFIESTFPGSSLKDLHQGMVHYQINNTTISWAKLFGTMEAAKTQFDIEDYSVSQTTLEQVFINFAKTQLPPTELNMTCTTKCGNCCSYICRSCPCCKK